MATKCEDVAGEERARELERGAGRPVQRISAVIGSGVRELLTEAYALARSTAGTLPGP